MNATTAKTIAPNLNVIIRDIRQTIGGWKRYGFLPCGVQVQDWSGLPAGDCRFDNARRWVLVLTFAPDAPKFLTEIYHHRDALALADYLNERMERVWDRLPESDHPWRPCGAAA